MRACSPLKSHKTREPPAGFLFQPPKFGADSNNETQQKRVWSNFLTQLFVFASISFMCRFGLHVFGPQPLILRKAACCRKVEGFRPKDVSPFIRPSIQVSSIDPMPAVQAQKPKSCSSTSPSSFVFRPLYWVLFELN